MGVAGTPSCLKSIRNQLPKRLVLFFSHCSLSAAITAMSRNSPTPTSRRRLQHAPCSVPAAGKDNSPYLYATHNKLGRKRRFILLLHGPNVVRTVMKEKRLVCISRQQCNAQGTGASI